MDFFEHQDRARSRSVWLVLYFGLAVILTTLAIYVGVAAFFFRFQFGADGVFAFWNTDVFLKAAIPTLLVIAAGSLFKISVLSRGGSVVAESLGGRLIEPNTSDPDERRVLNVVEEMSIASGTAVPTVYLLDDEPGINAFAAGFTPSDAVIGVTRGAVELLTRDELQGVIAHEFSHIFNGDMRLNIRLMGVLHGILLLVLIGYAILRRGHVTLRRKEGSAALVVALILLVVGGIGFFFGKLIKAAVSRQREFLADASAVQFTRNPDGLTGALKKIGGLAFGSRLESSKTREVSHMLFGNGLHDISRQARGDSPTPEASAGFQDRVSFLSTHPPLTERIRRIDPSFRGEFPIVELTGQTSIEPTPTAAPVERKARAPEVGTALAAAFPLSVDPDGFAALWRSPSQEHLAYAAGLLAAMPIGLKSKTKEPCDARAIILALLLSGDSEVRQAQFRTLNDAADSSLASATLDVSFELGRCPLNARLPLVDLCLPALRRMSFSQYKEFTSLVDGLVRADGKMELFEYTLFHILRRHLGSFFKKATAPSVQYRNLAALKSDCEILLSSLAHAGHQDPKAAEQAFARAVSELGEITDPVFRPRQECGLKPVRLALEKLALTPYHLRRTVLEASAASVSYDGRVTVKEGELLRAIADALECPMPPLLAGQKLRKSA